MKLFLYRFMLIPTYFNLYQILNFFIKMMVKYYNNNNYDHHNNIGYDNGYDFFINYDNSISINFDDNYDDNDINIYDCVL